MFREDRSREEARAHAKAGLGGFARAFNHCDDGDMGWRYSEDVQQRFVELAAELVHLVETGELRENPQHAHWRAAQAARRDPAVQRLIHQATREAAKTKP